MRNRELRAHLARGPALGKPRLKAAVQVFHTERMTNELPTGFWAANHFAHLSENVTRLWRTHWLHSPNVAHSALYEFMRRSLEPYTGEGLSELTRYLEKVGTAPKSVGDSC